MTPSSLTRSTRSLAVAAGCGGDDSKKKAADFNKGAKAATAQTSQLGTDLGSASSQTDAQLAVGFRGLTTRARAIVAKLRALKPPDSARKDVDALAAALSTGAKDLDAIATAARSSDVAAAKTATQVLLADSPAIKSANRALKADVQTASK